MGGWGRGVEGGGAGLLPVGGVGGGGRGELNKDVSRPDRGGETEGAEGVGHAWKVIKAA